MSNSTSEQVAGVELADPVLRAALEHGLTEVEELLRREVQSEFRFLTETSRHLIDAGGKRFRPLFTLLAGQFGPDQSRTADVVRAAAVVELVHLATLYHDDVMDEATLRRGAVSANAAGYRGAPQYCSLSDYGFGYVGEGTGGDYTASRYPATLESAVRSGRQAAQALITEFSKR